MLRERDRKLFRELSIMRVIDREQTKIVAGFGSTTRVNTRLLALSRAGFLKHAFVGTIAGGRKAVYALTPQSSAWVDVRLPALSLNRNLTLAGNLNLEHQMLGPIEVKGQYSWRVVLKGDGERLFPLLSSLYRLSGVHVEADPLHL